MGGIQREGEWKGRDGKGRGRGRNGEGMEGTDERRGEERRGDEEVLRKDFDAEEKRALTDAFSFLARVLFFFSLLKFLFCLSLSSPGFLTVTLCFSFLVALRTMGKEYMITNDHMPCIMCHPGCIPR
jgi:hypothetical protein